MGGEMESSTAGKIAPVTLLAGDGSLPWYKVVGIEFVLFVGILVPLIYGALLAR